MANKFSGDKHKQNFRPTKADWEILTKLKDKLGVEFANVVRLAIRTLAEKEGV